MSVKRNIVANYIGQGWRALMGLAFIPLYIQYLGIEAYGLIGIFAVLQAWLGLFDMGVKPALAREMSRFAAGGKTVQGIRDLLRSVEIFGVAAAATIALGLWMASPWVAQHWIKAQGLSGETVGRAVALMGAVTALRFVESIYVSSIVGLQRQVLENALSSAMATVRGLGAVGVLAWLSPSVEAFFIWQGIVSLATVALFAVAVHRTLPQAPRAGRFSISALVDIRRFAAGMFAITFLALLLTQVDKVLLSRLLTLEAFAHYALAGTVANALYLLTGPIVAAFYPRFTELLTVGDATALNRTFHQAAQLISVFVGAAGAMLMVFSGKVLALWTADPALAREVAPLMTILVLGTLFNALMNVPYQLQLAHGWTALAMKTNIAAVVILVPAIVWVVPRFGPLGAACVWVALNSGYLVFGIHLMHRRILVTEKWRWYLQDVAAPLVTAGFVAVLCRWITPGSLSRPGEFFSLLLSSLLVLVSTWLMAPLIRHHLSERVLAGIKALRAV